MEWNIENGMNPEQKIRKINRNTTMSLPPATKSQPGLQVLLLYVYWNVTF
jgi:hypothetical protein